MSQRKFHLKVKSVVERVLLFSNGELIGEMDEIVDETAIDEKIFNGFIDLEDNRELEELSTPLKRNVDAVFLCYCLGEDFMDSAAVFSLPFQTQPNDITSEYSPNAICVNYYLPKPNEDDYKAENVVPTQQIATAKFCLVDIPDRLQKGLGLPALIILPVTILTDSIKEIGAEELKKRGIDIRADGFFFKKIAHLWAKSDSDAADYRDEKIKIGLFAHSITKQIEIEL